MNTTVQAALDAELAKLTRVVDVPADRALGYGIDLSCVTDLTPDMAEVDPYTPIAIAEAQARRLQTGRGKLDHDPDYGTDVRGMLNQGHTQAELATLDTQVHNELIKDDRVATVDVTVTFTNQELLHVAVVSTAVGQLETFSLTFWATSSEILIEQLG